MFESELRIMPKYFLIYPQMLAADSISLFASETSVPILGIDWQPNTDYNRKNHYAISVDPQG